MTKSKQAQAAEAAERQEAIERLREMFPAGSTVSTCLKYVSRSGMLRVIAVHVGNADGGVSDVSHLVARALGDTYDPRRGGVRVGGAGMDMGYHIVYGLSYRLHGSGYQCTGEGDGGWNGCPSNTHVNPGPDRDTYGPGVVHTDGYALRHRWV